MKTVEVRLWASFIILLCGPQQKEAVISQTARRQGGQSALGGLESQDDPIYLSVKTDDCSLPNNARLTKMTLEKPKQTTRPHGRIRPLRLRQDFPFVSVRTAGCLGQ